MRFRALFTAGIATAGALLVAAPVEDTSVAAPDAVKFGPLYPVCKVDGAIVSLLVTMKFGTTI